MTERRFESRYLCADLVRVQWIENGDEVRLGEAVLEDISPLGACVQVEEPVPLGLPFTLSIGDYRFKGYVCYCLFRDYGYFVGVRFSEETTWSSENISPRHLTNLQTIAGLAATTSDPITHAQRRD